MTGPTPQGEFEEFLHRAGNDPRVLGVVLSGSRAREGTATACSDYDVVMVVTDGTEGAFAGRAARGAPVDVSAISLSSFRTHAMPGSGTEWNRYAFTHAKVLKDTADGLVAGLVSAKGRLGPEEAAGIAADALGAFLNSVYRCLKNQRDGNLLAARLDAAEALPFHLTFVFALHERVRPYNKYLSWELRHHPLGEPEWAHDHLLTLLADSVGAAAPTAIRHLLNELEPHARSALHGEVLDEWGQDLIFMRGGGGAAGPDS